MFCGPAAFGIVTVPGAAQSVSDLDADAHDFTSDGVLPETFASMHLVKSAQERAAQMASDCHEAKSVVGMADKDTVPQRFAFPAPGK